MLEEQQSQQQALQNALIALHTQHQNSLELLDSEMQYQRDRAQQAEHNSQQTLQTFSEHFYRLQSSLDISEQNRIELNQQLNDANATNYNLSLQFQNLRDEAAQALGNAQDENQEIAQEISQLIETINNTNTDKNTLINELQMTQSLAQNQGNRINQLQQELFELEETLNKTNADKNTLNNELQTALSLAQNRLSELDETLNKANADKDNLKNDLQAARLQAANQENRISQLQQELSEANDTLNKTILANENLNGELLEAQSLAQISAENLRNVQTESNDRQRQIGELKSQLRQQRQILLAMLRNANSDIEVLRLDYIQVVQQLRERIAQLEANNNRPQPVNKVKMKRPRSINNSQASNPAVEKKNYLSISNKKDDSDDEGKGSIHVPYYIPTVLRNTTGFTYRPNPTGNNPSSSSLLSKAFQKGAKLLKKL